MFVAYVDGARASLPLAALFRVSVTALSPHGLQTIRYRLGLPTYCRRFLELAGTPSFPAFLRKGDYRISSLQLIGRRPCSLIADDLRLHCCETLLTNTARVAEIGYDTIRVTHCLSTAQRNTFGNADVLRAITSALDLGQIGKWRCSCGGIDGVCVLH